ncbi:NTP transferase domain-containing protein [Arthrobacter sp. NPDC058130]|uniref:nucleotidyltransferase family protein n=1 Tax=Arthrobacter sp. NPDC058130 TaxID=3346353 RepID=UPI0036F100BD
MPETTAAAREGKVDVAAIILAAGAGSRYGYPKILAPGFLDAALGALDGAGVAKIMVVTGARRVVLPDNVQEVFCPRWHRGMGASLRSGLEAAAGAAQRLLLHVVDCPDVDSHVVRRILEQDTTRPARAVFEGKPGHPVVLPRPYVTKLLTVLDDAAGAGRYLAGLPELLQVECSDLASGHDIDVPGEAGQYTWEQVSPPPGAGN